MEAPAVQTLWLAPKQSCNVSVHIRSPSAASSSSSSLAELPSHGQVSCSNPPPAIIVHAPSHILLTIPYFSACLHDHWRTHTDIAHSTQLTLQSIAPSCPPAAYLRCLQLLLSPPPFSCSFASVSEALQTLSAADHLLFAECVDACMQYLAAVCWSWEEEVSIRSTFFTLGRQPSNDIKERLDCSKAAETLKALIHHVVPIHTKSSKTAFDNLVCKSFGSGSSFLVKTITDILTEECKSSLKELCESESKESIPKIAKSIDSISKFAKAAEVLLRETHAKEIVHAFGSNQELYAAVAFHCMHGELRKPGNQVYPRNLVYTIVLQVFEKVRNGHVILSNSERRFLVRMWMPLGVNLRVELPLVTKSRPNIRSVHDKDLEEAFGAVIQTLPYHDDDVVELMKTAACGGRFNEYYERWSEHLLGQLMASGEEAPNNVTSI